MASRRSVSRADTLRIYRWLQHNQGHLIEEGVRPVEVRARIEEEMGLDIAAKTITGIVSEADDLFLWKISDDGPMIDKLTARIDLLREQVDQLLIRVHTLEGRP